MTRVLPLNPSLEHLKKQAKHLLQAQREGDATACSVLRLLHRFSGASDGQITSASLTLHEAQFALALDYGFSSWNNLRDFVIGAKMPVAGERIGLGGIQLHGNPCTDDSFSKVMFAVCELLGKTVDPESLAMLSGNALSPAILLSETCPSWWHNRMQHQDLDLVAACVGLRVRLLPTTHEKGAPPMPENHESRAAWQLEYSRKPAAPYVRKAISSGEVVITDEQWDPRHHWNTWYGWGIVTEADDSGTILGACLNGRSDNPMTRAGLFRALSSSEPTIASEEAHTEMLRRAVSRIQSQGSDRPNDRRVYGVSAVDHWIHLMTTIPGFCPECAEGSAKAGQGWTCARDTGKMVHDGAAFAASYLRSHADRFPIPMRDHLPAIAAAYSRIAGLLQPAVTGDEQECYQAFVGDLDRQRSHTRNVLEPIKRELQTAAEAMSISLGGREV